MRPISRVVSASFLAAVFAAAGASAQIVLLDAPKHESAGEASRWLGKSGWKTPAHRRVLVTRDLKYFDASEVELGSAQIRYRDANGRMASVESASIVAMLPATTVVSDVPGSAKAIEWREVADAATGPQGRVELVDGQVVPGRLGGGETKQDSIAWEHPLLGKVQLPIESIARVVLKNDAGVAARPDGDGEPSNDVVWFTNGDVAKGVVESISMESPEQGGAANAGELAMDIAGKAFKTPLSRVAAVGFANPKKTPSGVFAWLRDGTVVGGASAEMGSASLTLEGASLGGAGGSHSLTIAWDEVAAVNLDVGKVVPLATLAMGSVLPGEGREWAIPPKVQSRQQAAGGVGEIELSGPIGVAWTLPSPARLVAMSASLHPAARMLGDCVVVVECGGETVRQRLNAQTPTFEIRLKPSDESKAATVRVTIESGEGGSIQDRVVLKRAMVVLGK